MTIILESRTKNNISLVSRSKTLIKQMLSFYKKDEYQKIITKA